MARKRYSDEDVLRLLRDMELLLAGGNDVASACRSVGISPTRRRFACLPGYGCDLLQMAQAVWRNG